MRDKVDELKQALKAKKDIESGQRPKNVDTAQDPGVEEGSQLQKIVQELEVELKKAKEEAQENQDKYLRLYAEFENFRKRVQKEKEELGRYAHEQIIKDLLPILDDFERALSHAEDAKDVKVLIDGLKLVEKQMVGVLERFGLKSFPALGEMFDPHLHEAMAHQDSHDYEPDTVMAEYRRGYQMHGKLIRPALVAVAKKPQTSQKEEGEMPDNMAGEAEIQGPTKH